jgi:hypothetical protein
VTGKRILPWKHRPAVGGRGRFRLIRLIGEDWLGQVWHGEDRLVGAEVTIRLVSRSLTQDRARVHAFRQQLNRVRQQLDHPNIAWVYHYNEGEDGPIEFVLMAEPGGQTLAHRLNREPGLQPREGLTIGAAIAEGLQAAHDRGFVHGALTPESVILSDDGDVKILDFGAAALRLDPDADPDTEGPARDVWALGKILPELVWSRSSTGGAVSASVPGEGVGGELARLWQASLDPDPARRPSAESLAFALRDAATKAGVAGSVRPSEVPEMPLKTEPNPPAPGEPPQQDGGVDELAQQARMLAEELEVEAPGGDSSDLDPAELAEEAVGPREAAKRDDQRPQLDDARTAPKPARAAQARLIEEVRREQNAASGTERPPSTVIASVGRSALLRVLRRRSYTGLLPSGRSWLMLGGVFLVTALVGFLLTRPEVEPSTQRTPQSIPKDTTGSEAIVMPDLRGLSYVDALTRLEATSLDMGRRVEAQGEAGIVVATDPSLGQLVRPGTAVTVYVGADPSDESAVDAL